MSKKKRRNKPIIENLSIGTYGSYYTFEEWLEDRYEYPSEFVEVVMNYVEDKKVKTDFESLKSLAKDVGDMWGKNVLIEPDGTILLWDTCY